MRAAIVIALALLAGCAHLERAGFYQMSNEWCAAHPQATERNCHHD